MAPRDSPKNFQPTELRKPWDLLDLFHYLNKVVTEWVYDDYFMEVLEKFIDKWHFKLNRIPKVKDYAVRYAIDHMMVWRCKFRVASRQKKPSIYRFMHSEATCKYLLNNLKICSLKPILSAEALTYLRKDCRKELNASKTLKAFVNAIATFSVSFSLYFFARGESTFLLDGRRLYTLKCPESTPSCYPPIIYAMELPTRRKQRERNFARNIPNSIRKYQCAFRTREVGFYAPTKKKVGTPPLNFTRRRCPILLFLRGKQTKA